MSLIELAARLRELDAKATAAPWYPGHLADDNQTCNCAYILDEGHCGGVATIHYDNGLPVGEGGNDAPSLDEAKANLLLIAELRNALPTILGLLDQDRK